MIFVSSWPARPTNGIALDVFVGARRFADEHQVGVGIADAEDDLRAPERVQLAAGAVADVRADRASAVGGVRTNVTAHPALPTPRHRRRCRRRTSAARDHRALRATPDRG